MSFVICHTMSYDVLVLPSHERVRVITPIEDILKNNQTFIDNFPIFLKTVTGLDNGLDNGLNNDKDESIKYLNNLKQRIESTDRITKLLAGLEFSQLTLNKIEMSLKHYLGCTIFNNELLFFLSPLGGSLADSFNMTVIATNEEIERLKSKYPIEPLKYNKVINAGGWVVPSNMIDDVSCATKTSTGIEAPYIWKNNNK